MLAARTKSLCARYHGGLRFLKLSLMSATPVRRPVDFFAFAVCVGLCFVWGLQQVAIKAAGDVVSPMLQAGLRSAVSALMLWAFNRYWLKETWNRSVRLRDALLVGLCFTGEFFFVSEGLRFTSAAHMSVLLYTAPLFSAVGLAVKLPEERLGLVQWAGLLLAFAGILVAFLLPALTDAAPADDLWWLGDALGLCAGISWGFATIFLRTTTMNGAPASQMLFWQLATGAVILTAIAFLTGECKFEPTTVGWASLLFQTFIVSFASYLVWNWLLRRYLASRLGVLLFMTPIFGVVLSVVLLDESVGIPFLVGSALVLCGLLLAQKSGRRRK